MRILFRYKIIVQSWSHPGHDLSFVFPEVSFMDMGTQPGEKHTQRFIAVQVLLVVNKGKIKATNFKVMIHPALSLNPNIFKFPASQQRLLKG